MTDHAQDVVSAVVVVCFRNTSRMLARIINPSHTEKHVTIISCKAMVKPQWRPIIVDARSLMQLAFLYFVVMHDQVAATTYTLGVATYE